MKKKEYTLLDYIKDESLPAGANKYNAYFLQKAKESMHQFNIDLAFLYRLKDMNVDDHVYGLFISLLKQRNLWKSACTKFKEKQIDDKYVKSINKALKQTEERGRYVYNIIKDILYTTKYYPYFERGGFEKVENLIFGWDSSFEEQFDVIFDECEKFIEEHPRIISKHLKDTEEERLAYENHMKEVKEKEKAEKKVERQARKEADNEVKEIKRNNEKYRKQQEKINRSFEKYWT